MFSNALESVKVTDLISNVGSSAAAAPAPVAVQAAAKPSDKPAAKKGKVNCYIIYFAQKKHYF